MKSRCCPQATKTTTWTSSKSFPALYVQLCLELEAWNHLRASFFLYPVLPCPSIGSNRMVPSHSVLTNIILVCLSRFPLKVAHLPHYTSAIPHFHCKVGQTKKGIQVHSYLWLFYNKAWKTKITRGSIYWCDSEMSWPEEKKKGTSEFSTHL